MARSQVSGKLKAAKRRALRAALDDTMQKAEAAYAAGKLDNAAKLEADARRLEAELRKTKPRRKSSGGGSGGLLKSLGL